jgi:hypothetical protein
MVLRFAAMSSLVVADDSPARYTEIRVSNWRSMAYSRCSSPWHCLARYTRSTGRMARGRGAGRLARTAELRAMSYTPLKQYRARKEPDRLRFIEELSEQPLKPHLCHGCAIGMGKLFPQKINLWVRKGSVWFKLNVLMGFEPARGGLGATISGVVASICHCLAGYPVRIDRQDSAR